MNLKQKVKNLPSSPGVYLMKDRQHNIIYVGKAKNLKKRVQSYFYQSNAHSPKTKKLVAMINEIDYIQTDTEFEAFMLECQLIKEIKPYFNRKMKNPQSYTYITVGNDGQQRSLDTTPHPIDGNLNFGPFISKYTVQKALQGIKDTFRINCSGRPKQNTACLNYSLGLCGGSCLGGLALAAYNTIIDKFIALLNDTDTSIVEEMEQQMQIAAERFDFETAAKIRDSLNLINFLLTKERVIEFTAANQNIAIIENLDDTNFKFFLIKGNKIVFSEKYSRGQASLLTMATHIATYFTKNSSSLEVTRDDIDEAQIIYSYLKSSQCRYFIIPDDWLEDHNSIQDALNENFKHVDSP